MPTATAGLSCPDCHADKHTQWAQGAHAKTQVDVASELAQSHPGETPGAVVLGEDCIACHGPAAVLANGGMSESQALGYFFTTTNGLFSAGTTATNNAAWPHVTCITCHSVPSDHPDTMPTLALFESRTGQYVPMDSASKLCGQCHGNLRFPDTDHQLYNGWVMSKHANTQTDVATELSQSHPGESPVDVAKGEDCVGCHAPTAVLANGGMSAGQALGYFFTAGSNGLFSANTVSDHITTWPGVACTACHDPHDAGKPSYFNSATMQYESMTNSAQLCGQCHGNLRFPDTDHLTYNLMVGAGGIGVTNQQSMPGVSCTDCHMYNSQVDGSNSKMLRGHSWAITVPEPGGTNTSSCTSCHSDLDDRQAALIIDNTWRLPFQTNASAAEASVARAATAMLGNQNPTLLATLDEAQVNLAYAESDEGGGVHNHPYLMALLNHAKAKALSMPILDTLVQGAKITISWTGQGTLQAADSIPGPWHDVSGATNPMVISPPLQTQPQFYRLRP
jgi:hypothetical protein